MQVCCHIEFLLLVRLGIIHNQQFKQGTWVYMVYTCWLDTFTFFISFPGVCCNFWWICCHLSQLLSQFFLDFLRNRDDFMSTLRILSQLSQLFWVSTFTLNFSSEVNNFLCFDRLHVFIPFSRIGKIVLRFHKLSWCVFQFSVDLSPFVAIAVAIFFLIFSEIGMISWLHSGFCRNCRNYFEFLLLVHLAKMNDSRNKNKVP